MKRLFLFSIEELQYEKNDLNIPFSKNRLILGQLSRLITNTIFLSHSLRKNIVIRILVRKPIDHIIQIKSDTIRYLGPEERSLGSILLKVKKNIEEKIQQNNLLNDWFEPNPGIFVKFTKDALNDISKELIEPISFISLNSNNSENILSFNEFEKELTFNATKYNSLIFHFDLNKNFEFTNELKMNISSKFEILEIRLCNKYDFNKIVSIINIILDGV